MHKRSIGALRPILMFVSAEMGTGPRNWPRYGTVSAPSSRANRNMMDLNEFLLNVSNPGSKWGESNRPFDSKKIQT